MEDVANTNGARSIQPTTPLSRPAAHAARQHLSLGDHRASAAIDDLDLFDSFGG